MPSSKKPKHSQEDVPKADPFEIGGISIAPGESRAVELPLSLMSDHTPVTVTVQVAHGRRPGPRLFVSAAIHGDETNGVEIIRRLLMLPTLRRIRGTLLAVPLVNTFGFLTNSRYLPDRRDLNRSFPGSTNGSLAAQLANLFITEIVERCTHGIDLHTGAIHRSNLPQLRCDLTNPEIERLALAFGPPVVLHADPLDGSLRDVVRDMGIPIVLYEGGEALRLDELAIRAGLRGILRVMHELGMIRRGGGAVKAESLRAYSSYWVRAPAGGLFVGRCRLGEHVKEGQEIGTVNNPYGERDFPVQARDEGVVIGRNNLPVVNQGDALFHIARVKNFKDVAKAIGALHHELPEEVGSADDYEPL